ncbi:MAG: type II secretion system protein [Phycisphaerales bacterium]|nr:type II secretion system protein [Phycisphaerales bacterium]
MVPRPRSRPRGFTLVETLVVAVIIGLLAVMVVPSVASALGDVNREAALARARQVHTMVTRYNQFLPGGGPAISTADGAISQPDLARLVTVGYCDPDDLTNHLTGTPSWSFASGKVVPGP